MLGFQLDIWDYLTFATLLLTVVAFLAFFVFMAGLPGRIAISRNHPEAEAVKLLGWAGLLPTIYPWVQALIWAYKPTDVVDIRRFPREEAIATAANIERLKGTPMPAAGPGPDAKVPNASSASTGADTPRPSGASVGHGESK
jgi:hypothetical protein